jgi:MFS family permease
MWIWTREEMERTRGSKTRSISCGIPVSTMDDRIRVPMTSRDLGILCASAFLRSMSVGGTGVLLGVYLPRVGVGPGAMGIVIALGLAGGAVATLLTMAAGHRAGKRRLLAALSLLAGAGGLAAALASSPVALGAVAFLGMLNGMGRDRGAALVLEQAILPATVPPDARTRAFAWYNVLQDAGHALGALVAVVPHVLRSLLGLDELFSLRIGMAVCALLACSPAFLAPRLSPSADAVPTTRVRRVSPETRAVLWKISALFGLDSLAGGFLTTALLSYFFFERFGVGEGTIGLLFLLARVANAVSHLCAAWLARRIGLVNTMVFTHIPSSFLLACAVFAPSFPVAAALFLLREGLVEMDVPTRQSYVMAVVRPEERLVASGITHLVRVAAWAVAPAFAGFFIQSASLAMPFLVGAGMKVGYDVLLWSAFRRTRPPEESATGCPTDSVAPGEPS